MSFLSRFVFIIVGLALSIVLATTALIVGAFMDPHLRETAEQVYLPAMIAIIEAIARVEPSQAYAQAVAGARVLLGAMLVAPVTVAALIGEAARVGAMAWYVGAAALLSAATPWMLQGVWRPWSEWRRHDPLGLFEWRLSLLLFVVGAIAGLAYWLMAGRAAGVSSRPRKG